MFRSVAMNNWKAVKLMLKTAAPLSTGYLIINAEWEILGVLAGIIGPAEIAAWGLIGWLWNMVTSRGDKQRCHCPSQIVPVRCLDSI